MNPFFQKKNLSTNNILRAILARLLNAPPELARQNLALKLHELLACAR
jgi:hypothetical protein